MSDRHFFAQFVKIVLVSRMCMSELVVNKLVIYHKKY